MLEGFSPSDLAPLSAPALVALAVLLLYTGRLVPAKERDYWRAAFFEQLQMCRDLTATSQATRDVLLALPPAPPIPPEKNPEPT